MKRQREESDEEEEPSTSRARVEEVDILRDLQNNLSNEQDLNKHINNRFKETEQQYWTVYMEKLMKQVPMGKNIVEIVSGKENSFEYMFTASKSLIQSRNNVRRIKSLHAVFDMVYGIGFRFVHEKVIAPSLSHVVKPSVLNGAYERFAKCKAMDEDETMLELQSLLYCIQETLNKNKPFDIPNPLYTRMVEQLKGLSEYVVALLMHASVPREDVEIHQANPQEVER